MGATQAMYGLTQNLTYFQKKWSLVTFLAPPITLRSMSDSPVLDFMSNEVIVSMIVNSHKMIGSYEFEPANWANSGTFKVLCGLLYDICMISMSIIADNDPTLNNADAAKVYFAHYPSGSALKQAEHFTMIARAEKFIRYDYGKAKNLLYYG